MIWDVFCCSYQPTSTAAKGSLGNSKTEHHKPLHDSWNELISGGEKLEGGVKGALDPLMWSNHVEKVFERFHANPK